VILLDVLFEAHCYPALVNAPIVNEWIQTDDNLFTVQIPSADAITGDKLTAYAPNTVGIRFRVEHADGGVTEKQTEVTNNYLTSEFYLKGSATSIISNNLLKKQHKRK